MSALTSNKTYAALAGFQAFDAVICAIPAPQITKALDAVNCPQEVRPVLPVVKGLSVIGLLAVYRFPALARLTTFMLTIYFVLAVGSHIKAKDYSPGLGASSSLLALFAAMTALGPEAEETS
ncbi:DoxX family protein [Mycolicibacterium brumae]|uniref:DoxX family protein n=1 Tax=Mycolicibacterium brumae TaxID=85968 RepID=A0A2G5PA01_9MYCO|nr:DoxX family protein [Mycolicibacterium brumae]MCV7193699.1 DoxX family protein [Mycolicibacterium brumae]PIB75087.1 hypothetical protein CQY22_010810 [Mycolicibacterium brumae]RWA17399.1 hypothetical protein MBRU_07155 [Mycolicibacterium brumae DSM 44177]UWW09028.1 DoxX family protein [Mycolicibacterium brumae]